MTVTSAMMRRKLTMFSSFWMCCLSASLLAAAFGTEYWFVSDSRWENDPEGVSGSVHFGLFKGINNYNNRRTYTLYVECMNDICMYSCADTKEHREEQLQMLLDGKTANLKDNCLTNSKSLNVRRPTSIVNSTQAQLRGDVKDMRKTNLGTLFSLALSPMGVMSVRRESESVEGAHRALDSQAQEADVILSSTTDTTTDQSIPDKLEFMDYGLWVGTIACLSVGLLMAVVGALFAIVNTATTPVEAITGVPGLYLWNTLAALFDMVTVILWAVQFHKHLTSNVLLYDSSDGWSTEGMEVFGYSFWLVVVAIFVHVANIVIIVIGTWEPKKRDQLQAPETKGGNIMLY